MTLLLALLAFAGGAVTIRGHASPRVSVRGLEVESNAGYQVHAKSDGAEVTLTVVTP